MIKEYKFTSNGLLTTELTPLSGTFVRSSHGKRHSRTFAEQKFHNRAHKIPLPETSLNKFIPVQYNSLKCVLGIFVTYIIVLILRLIREHCLY